MPEAMRLRAERVASLLGLLDSGRDLPIQVEHSTSLTSRTMRSIELAQAARDLQAQAPDAALCIDDEEALDAFVAAGYRADRVNSALRGRAAQTSKRWAASLPRQMSARMALPILPPEPSSESAAPAPVAADAGGIAGRIGVGRLADLFSIAAAAVLGVSVLWPVLSARRQHSTKTLCGSNMATVASAMGAYANDYRSQMPVATASLLGPTWWMWGHLAGPFQLGQSLPASLVLVHEAQ